MKKQRIRLSAGKMALFISIICTVGALALGASILLQPQNRAAARAEQTAAAPHPAEMQPVIPLPTTAAAEKDGTVPQKTAAHTADTALQKTEKTAAATPAPVKPAESFTPPPAKNPPAKAVPVSGKKEPPKKPPVPVPDPVKPAPSHRGTLIVVFDDAGYNTKELRKFIELPFPVTVAVLPGLDYSADAARLAREAGKEVILHQPMQAKNLAVNPGPRAVLPDMTAEEAALTVRSNIRDLWPISGLNNHEGSLITESEPFMDAVLAVCEAEGIYFLDSRTTAQTAAPAAAQKRGAKIWERSVFLDNTQERADIEKAVLDGAALAEKRGSAILIGHVWSKELADILREMYPALTAQGFSFSTISRLGREAP